MVYIVLQYMLYYIEWPSDQLQIIYCPISLLNHHLIDGSVHQFILRLSTYCIVPSSTLSSSHRTIERRRINPSLYQFIIYFYEFIN